MWDGFANARDLGGLPTTDLAVTSSGNVYRSADVDSVTERGWEQAAVAGVRTVVDLRNDDEASVPVGAAAAGIEIVRVPLDDVADVAMWAELRADQLDGTPLYYRPFLDRKPERVADVLVAIARAPRGGLIFHCGAGRDRTGLVALLLLALADVEPVAIAEDYEQSAHELPAILAARGRPDESAAIARSLARHGTTVHRALLAVLDGFDVTAYLRGAGVSAQDVAAARARLRVPVAAAGAGRGAAAS